MRPRCDLISCWDAPNLRRHHLSCLLDLRSVLRVQMCYFHISFRGYVTLSHFFPWHSILVYAPVWWSDSDLSGESVISTKVTSLQSEGSAQKTSSKLWSNQATAQPAWLFCFCPHHVRCSCATHRLLGPWLWESSHDFPSLWRGCVLDASWPGFGLNQLCGLKSSIKNRLSLQCLPNPVCLIILSMLQTVWIRTFKLTSAAILFFFQSFVCSRDPTLLTYCCGGANTKSLTHACSIQCANQPKYLILMHMTVFCCLVFV